VSDAAVARTTKAIAGMVDEARGLGVLTVVAVGTAGLRMAANRDAVVDAIEARTGVRIEIISGEEEGRLAYVAARASLDHAAGRLAVFDSGGGSTQFTFGDGATVEDRFSVDVGAARYTDRFGLDAAVASEVVEQAREAIRTDLARLDGRPVPDALVGMGGAVTNLAAVMHGLVPYDPAAVRGTVLGATEVERQIELYRSLDGSARQTVVGLQPDRAEVILAGACIVRVIMEKLGVRALTVSDRGLRHGVLEDRFGAAPPPVSRPTAP
jgi:exopolyphosphatase/guanosine-5'-triphosphate,3'-diphosphate pyrophosphatase